MHAVSVYVVTDTRLVPHTVNIDSHLIRAAPPSRTGSTRRPRALGDELQRTARKHRPTRNDFLQLDLRWQTYEYGSLSCQGLKTLVTECDLIVLVTGPNLESTSHKS